MKVGWIFAVAGAFTAAWVQVASVVAPGNCSVDNCAVAHVLVGAAFLLFPLLLGGLLENRGEPLRVRALAAATTGGVAALSMAVGFLIEMDPSDSERVAFAAGFAVVVAPVATLLGIPLVSAGMYLRRGTQDDAARTAAPLVCVLGALTMAAGALMPWTTASLGIVDASASGVGGRGWGFVALASAIVILGAVGRQPRSPDRNGSLVILAASAVSIGLALFVLADPGSHYDVENASRSIRPGFGIYVSFAGGAVALAGGVGLHRARPE